MAEAATEMKPDSPPTKRKKASIAMEWGGKSLIALLPALATGYFATLQAKYESQIEVAKINAKAGAGYETLKEAIQKLEETSRDHERTIEQLASLISVESLRVATPTARPARPRARATGGGLGALSGVGAGLGAGAGSSSAPSALTPPEKLFANKPLQIPATLDEAVAAKAAK